MRNLRRSFWIIACSILAPSLASAAPIPTPSPGTSTVLTAPAPNPAQFNFAPLNPLPAGQLNSNFYGLWNQFTALINTLNATGAGAYGCGPCVTSIVNGAGMNASLGAQSSGVGTALTIALTSPVAIANGGTGATSAATVAGQNIAVSGTFPNQTVALSGVVPIANGGTGSGTQNFVDLTNTQTIAGLKSFSSTVSAPQYSIGSVKIADGTAFNNKIYTVSGGNLYIESSAGVDNAHFPDGGGLVFDRGNFSAGTGTIQGSSNASTVSYAPICYTIGGTACASTAHYFSGQQTYSGTCAQNTLCTYPTLTFSGAAAFTSSASFSCTANAAIGVAALASVAISSYGASNVTFTLYHNFAGGIVNPTIMYSCKGT